MKRLMKKIISVLLIAVLFSGVLSVTPFAAAVKAVNVKTEDDLRTATKKDGSVKLTADIVLNDIIVIPSGVDVSLDLNGKTLSRKLDEYMENGSVIRVEEGATLTVSDGTKYNEGTITGGASFVGGGIYNNGTLAFEGGTLVGNKADGNGGGIYNNGTLYLKGGFINYNEAVNGAGIYNDTSGTVIIEQNKIVEKVGASSSTRYTNISITKNIAEEEGSGIYNANKMSISGAAVISGNENYDIYLSSGKYITFTGEITTASKASVKTTGENAVITKDYSKYNAKRPSELFTSADTNAALVFSSAENGEIMLKTDNKTLIQVFENGKIVKREETDSTDFVSVWNKVISYSKNNKSVWGFTTDDSVVEITLGRDYSYDAGYLSTTAYKSIILDLNGHYVKRAGKKKKSGYLFKVAERSKFTIKDSNPYSKGYADHKGGVIADGNGDDCCGCILIETYGQFYMDGGTIYNCKTDYHGGAVYAGADFTFIDMRNCTIDSCMTKDSGDDCHGGGIYVKNATNVLLYNVTFKNCHAEDKGGALYLREKPRNVVLKNCSFINNYADDGGGAIFIDDLKGDTEFSFEAENCLFHKNRAGEDGGAVYVYDDDESEHRNPTVFRNCTFTENESKKYAGAIEVNDNGVVLFGGSFTKNKASEKGGAIYVEGEYDISVAGKLVIKDNDGKDKYDNLCLEENGSHKAYIYDAGLYEGSDVRISTSNNKTGIAAVKGVSEYQSKYFKAESGKLEFMKTGEKKAAMVTASLFGEGATNVIITLSAVAVLTVAAAIIFKKKKGAEQNVDDDDEE